MALNRNSLLETALRILEGTNTDETDGWQRERNKAKIKRANAYIRLANSLPDIQDVR